MSNGEVYKGPWNEGKSPEMNEEWQYIDEPLQHIIETGGLVNEEAIGTERTEKSVQKYNKALSAKRKAEIEDATDLKKDQMNWTNYVDLDKMSL
jgi:Mn-containing catalase